MQGEKRRCLCASHPSGRYFVVLYTNGEGMIRMVGDVMNTYNLTVPGDLYPSSIHISQTSLTPFFIVGSANGDAFLYSYMEADDSSLFKMIKGDDRSPILSCWTGTMKVDPSISEKPIYMCILGRHSGTLSIFVSATLSEDLDFVEIPVEYHGIGKQTSPIRFISYSGNQLVVIRHDKTMDVYNTTIGNEGKLKICLDAVKIINGPDLFMTGTEIYSPSLKGMESPEGRLLAIYWRNRLVIYAGRNFEVSYSEDLDGFKNLCNCITIFGSNPSKSLLVSLGSRGNIQFHYLCANGTENDKQFGLVQKGPEHIINITSIPCGLGYVSGVFIIALREGDIPPLRSSDVKDLNWEP